MRIQFKLLIFVLSASLVPLIVATGIAIFEADKVVEETELEFLSQLVTEEIHEFELTIKVDTQDAILLAHTPSIVTISHELQLGELHDFDTNLILVEKTRMLNYWEDIMRIKPNLLKMEYNDGLGNEIASIIRNADGSFTKNVVTVSDIDHLNYLSQSQNLKEGEIYVSDLFSNSKTSDDFFISYITPIFVNEVNHGFIIIDFFPKEEFVNISESHKGYESFILNNQMKLITSKEFTKNYYFDYLQENLSYLIIDGFFDGEMNSFETKDSVDIGWQKFTYDQSDLDRFFILVIVSGLEAESEINDVLIFTLIVTAFVVTIISLIISRSISKPMIELSKLSTKVVEGILEPSTAKPTKDEIGNVLQNFNKMIKQLLKIDKERDEFASMITHELKTPLVPIKGHADMLSKSGMLGELNSSQLESVEEIRKYTKIMADLIEQFLLVHKLEIDKVPFTFQKLDVKSCLIKAHSANLPNMNDKKIDFTVDALDGLYINGDLERCGEVFTNIIQNAIDFVPDKNGKISLFAKRSGDNVEVTISDNGIGISKKDQKNLFLEKFYQVDKSLKRRHSGSGLGLYICKSIIEKHGGTISIDSDTGKGCKIIIKVPAI